MWMAVLANSVIAAFGLVLLVFGLALKVYVLLVLGVILLVPISLIVLLHPSCEMDRESPQMRVGQRRPKTVQLTDIAAIGMVYTTGRYFDGWRPCVWLGDSTVTGLPLGTYVGQAPARGRATGAGSLPDWARLSATRQGQLCNAVFDRASAKQGPNGLLAADRQTERRGLGGRHERVYWSASRRIGVNPLTHDT